MSKLAESEARGLVNDSIEFLHAWAAGAAAVDMAPALRLVRSAVEHFDCVPQRRFLRSVLANLSPVLVVGGLWDAVDDALSRTLAAEPDSVELRECLGLLLANLLHAARARGPAETADLPELWMGIAEAAPANPACWEAVAAVAGAVGVDLAQSGEWAPSARALAPLRHVPARHASATAPARARAYRAIVIAALARSRLETAADALGELRALSRFAETPEVDRPLAEALTAAVRHPPLMLAVGRQAYLELTGELIGLARRRTGERAVAAAFLSAAPCLGPAVLARDGASAFLEALCLCAGRWCLHLPLVAMAAESVELLARAGCLAPGNAGPLIAEAAETLAHLRDLAPADTLVVACAARFSVANGLVLREPRLPAAVSPIHPDVLALRALARDLESSPDCETADLLLSAFLGKDSDPLPLVAIRGAEIYRQDEGYFHDLLDEIARLLEGPGGALWRVLLPRLDEVTGHLVIQATDRIATEAQELRERLGFPQMIRLPTAHL